MVHVTANFQSRAAMLVGHLCQIAMKRIFVGRMDEWPPSLGTENDMAVIHE